jgi:hypothetical protein
MNGDRLAACGLGLLTIWRTDDFSVVNTMNLKNQCDSVEFSPDDKLLVATKYDSPKITVIDSLSSKIET